MSEYAWRCVKLALLIAIASISFIAFDADATRVLLGMIFGILVLIYLDGKEGA